MSPDTQDLIQAARLADGVQYLQIGNYRKDAPKAKGPPQLTKTLYEHYAQTNDVTRKKLLSLIQAVLPPKTHTGFIIKGDNSKAASTLNTSVKNREMKLPQVLKAKKNQLKQMRDTPSNPLSTTNFSIDEHSHKDALNSPAITEHHFPITTQP